MEHAHAREHGVASSMMQGKGRAIRSAAMAAACLMGILLLGTSASAADRELYAKWTPVTYAITYVLNGGTAENPATYTIETPTFSLTEPTKDHYDFTGWTGTGLASATKAVSIATGSTGSRSYEAHYAPTAYPITYSLDGGTATNPMSYTIETPTFSLSEPSREGYSFAGWTGTDIPGPPQKTVPIIQGSYGERSYAASYSPISYAISYSLGGGTATNPTSYTIETPTFALSAPTRTGYTFSGWTGSCGTAPQASVSIPIGSTGDKSYQAGWTANQYEVRFHANGGSGTMPDQTFTYDVQQRLTGNSFTREGYKFGGWAASPTEEDLYWDKENVKNLTSAPNGTYDLYATWDPVTYEITLDLQGGQRTAGKTVRYTIETDTFTLPTDVTMDGNTFTGWTKEGGTSIVRNVSIPKGTTGNMTYLANYQYPTLTFINSTDKITAIKTYNGSSLYRTYAGPSGRMYVTCIPGSKIVFEHDSSRGWLYSDTSYTRRNLGTGPSCYITVPSSASGLAKLWVSLYGSDPYDGFGYADPSEGWVNSSACYPKLGS